MRRALVLIVSSLLLVSLTPLAAQAHPGRAPHAASAPSDLEMAWFVDYFSHAGPGPHPASCSGSFGFIAGGISWSISAVSYDLLSGTIPAGLGAGAVATAVQSSFDAWSGAEASAPDFAEAGGVANTVSWASLGGTGIVAATAVSYIPRTKTIVGFDMFFNDDLDWDTGGSAGAFDVQNVGTHEAGHAFGLGHVNAPKDGLETMYKLTDEGELIKQSLCTGDVAGITALY